jgi:hypothetical protein
MWCDYETRMLIEERRKANVEYWSMAGCSKVSFWTCIAGKINSTFKSSYTAVQCKEKFQNLIRENTVRKLQNVVIRNLTLHFFHFFFFFFD